MRPTDQQSENTLRYLERFIGPSQNADEAPAAFVSATFARACVLLDSAQRAAADRVADEADRLSHWILQHPRSENLDLDPLILASHYQLLTAHEVVIPAYTSLVERIAQALRQMPAEIANKGRIRLVARILRNSGVEANVPPIGRNPHLSSLEDPASVLAMEESALTHMLDHALADGKTCSEAVSTALALVALSDFRNYRIDLACRILRYLFAHGHDVPYVKDAIDFIALQRRANGGYGFFDPERCGDIAPDKLETEYHLPITLNCVWTLYAANRTRSESASPQVGSGP